MYKTEWTHQPVPLTEAQQLVLDREIALISEDLDSASDLIFHTVFLDDDMDGKIVIVDGRDGEHHTLFLTYYETPDWVSLSEI
jgi:hypothetical protein